MDSIHDLSIWESNRNIQQKIKTYLCDVNGGYLKYKDKKNGKTITLYNSFLGVRRDKDYLYFVNKIGSIEKLQQRFKRKIDYKKKDDFYVVSVQIFKNIDEILCPRIYHFAKKSEAINYAHSAAIILNLNAPKNIKGYYKIKKDDINYLITTQKGINK